MGSFHGATALVKLKPETPGSDENPVSGPAIVFNFLNVSKTNACPTIYSRHLKNELNEITKRLLARTSVRGIQQEEHSGAYLAEEIFVGSIPNCFCIRLDNVLRDKSTAISLFNL